MSMRRATRPRFITRAGGAASASKHEDNANTMGRMAGESMAGASIDYDYLPMFYSDLFELGYEAVGDTDPRWRRWADWEEPITRASSIIWRDDRVRGVLLWNVWEQVTRRGS